MGSHVGWPPLPALPNCFRLLLVRPLTQIFAECLLATPVYWNHLCAGSTQGVGGRGAGASGATEQQVSFKACFCPVTAALRAVIMPGEKLPIVLHMDGVAGTAASAEQALGRPLFTWAAVEGPHNNTR